MYSWRRASVFVEQGQLMAQFIKSVGMEGGEEGHKITAASCSLCCDIRHSTIHRLLCKSSL